MKRKYVLTIACLSLVMSVAYAYLPPSFYVVKSIAKKNSKIGDGAGFSHKIKTYSSSGTVDKTLIETMQITDRGTATIQIADEAGKSIQRHIRNISGNKELEMSRPVLYDLLYVKDFNSIFEHLKALKLPLYTEEELYATRGQAVEGAVQPNYTPEKESALVRYDNRAAVVLGIPTEQTKGSLLTDRLKNWNGTMQLWVEKESLIPLKVVIPSQSATDGYRLEIQLSQYQLYKDFLYPRLIKIFKNDALWMSLETTEVNLDQKSLPTLKHTSDASDVRDFLDLYFKIIR